MNKIFLWAILLISTYTIVNAQNQPVVFNTKSTEFFQNNPAEKIYLQSDRDVYTVNDTIWFKISLTDAHSNVLDKAYRNIYVEMVNDSNQCVIRNLVVAYGGVAGSDFILSNYELPAGKYKLRTYTQYQRNFGTEFYFEKNILIKELYANQMAYQHIEDSIKAIIPNNLPEEKIDFQILPEGGYLCYGMKNIMAFKALSPQGRSVEVSGYLKDENDSMIAEISTIHAGMGKVKFTPVQGKQYYITLNEYPAFKAQVPEAEHKVKLTITPFNDLFYKIAIRKYIPFKQEQQFYLVACGQGVNAFFHPITMEGALKSLRVNKSFFRHGINRVILTDEQMNPITERLIFVDKEQNMHINMNLNGKKFALREQINIKLSTKVDTQQMASNVSVCALNVNQNIQLEDYPQNIQSYLLLDSELKGHIENPSYYFKDDSTSTLEKLDLLLLTQGWSNYVWSKFDETLPNTEHVKDFGLEISGKIKRLYGKKNVKAGKVSVIMNNGAGFHRFNQTKANADGTFKFPPLLYPDTISTFFQGVNNRDVANIRFGDIKTFLDIPEDVAPFLDFSTPNEQSQREFNQAAYRRLMEDKAYNPEKYEHLLDEVTVTKNRTNNAEKIDGHARQYSFADNVIKVNEDTPFFSNIWDFLAGSAAGVLVTGNSVSIRGGDEPLFLIDGSEVEKEVFETLTIYEIDKIEILKNASNLAIYGLKGGNGAIAVYTKKGEISYKNIKPKGVKTQQIRGYALSREFYNPNYKINKPQQADYRTTLYWNPSINIDSTGIANISFYTSDDPSPILLKVEGISANGETGVAYQLIDVEAR